MSNPITTIIDNHSRVWRYYDGSFWTVAEWEGKYYMQAAPALADGNIDISGGEINSCDVEDCFQRHVDFVNDAFGTSFVLRGNTVDNPSGTPAWVIPNF